MHDDPHQLQDLSLFYVNIAVELALGVADCLARCALTARERILVKAYLALGNIRVQAEGAQRAEMSPLEFLQEIEAARDFVLLHHRATRGPRAIWAD
jgi:hypothetical protein